MMKFLKPFAVIAILISICACNSKTTDSQLPIITPVQTESGEPTISLDAEVSTALIIGGENIDDVSDMNIYSQTLHDDFSVYAYVRADMCEGELAFDDGQDWSLYCEINAEIYALVPRTYLQLGGLDYDVYIDENDIVNVLVEKATTASIEIIRFEYDAGNKAFIQHDVMTAGNINYFGNAKH